jgi:two-component system, OmpR family, response regulator
MSKKVLFINKASPASVIPDVLSGIGCEVTGAYDDATALHRLEYRAYDLVILVENAAAESWTSCADIRRMTTAPFIIISPGASAESCVKAIDAGADFFLRKPFGPMELTARVNALLQRTPAPQPVPLIS